MLKFLLRAIFALSLWCIPALSVTAWSDDPPPSRADRCVAAAEAVTSHKSRFQKYEIAGVDSDHHLVSLSDQSIFNLDLTQKNSQGFNAATHVDVGRFKLIDSGYGTEPRPHLESGLHTYHAFNEFLKSRPDLARSMVIHVQQSSGLIKIHMPRDAFTKHSWDQAWRALEEIDSPAGKLRPVVVFPAEWDLGVIQSAVNTAMTTAHQTATRGRHGDLATYFTYKNVKLRIEAWFDAPMNSWILVSVYPQEGRFPWDEIQKSSIDAHLAAH